MNGRNEKPVLAILDSDQVYTRRLADFMNARNGFPFEACAFTDPVRYLEYAAGREVTVLLADEELLFSGEEQSPEGEDNAALTGSALLCLVLESRTGGGEIPEDLILLKRYQPADALIDKLLQAAAGNMTGNTMGSSAGSVLPGSVDAGADGDEQTLEGRPGRGRMYELVGVFSPAGCREKTAFVLALGEALAENRRTVYLNLERCSGLKQLGIVEEAAGDVSDLIYFFRTDPGSLVYRLGTLVRTFRNLDYIPPAAVGEDLMRIRAGEWAGVFGALTDAGEYEVILLDLDISARDLIPLLGICDRVYMPVTDDGISEAKTAEFMETARMLGGGETEEFRRVYPPLLKEEPAGRDAPARMLRGKMGPFVRRLLEQEEEDEHWR